MHEAPQLDLDAHRDAGDLIATTLVLFARHALLFLSVTLLIVAPVVILIDGVWAGGFADGGGADVTTAPAIAAAVPLLLTPVLVTALHVTIVRDLGEGRVPTVMQALRSAAPRFPLAIAALAGYALLVMGGVILLIVPGIWVFVAGYFATQAAVMERRGPLDAFRRSSELVEDRWWRTAGTLVFGLVVLNGAFYPMALAIDKIDSGAVYIAVSILLEVLTLSLSALFGTLLYFSLRARKAQPSGPALVGGYLPPLSPTPAGPPPAEL